MIGGDRFSEENGILGKGPILRFRSENPFSAGNDPESKPPIAEREHFRFWPRSDEFPIPAPPAHGRLLSPHCYCGFGEDYYSDIFFLLKKETLFFQKGVSLLIFDFIEFQSDPFLRFGVDLINSVQRMQNSIQQDRAVLAHFMNDLCQRGRRHPAMRMPVCQRGCFRPETADIPDILFPVIEVQPNGGYTHHATAAFAVVDRRLD